MLIMYIETIYI